MDKYNLENINCPLCNSNRSTIYIKNAKELYNDMDEYFNVERCEDCGHYFTNPRPTMDTIEYFYPDSAGYYQPNKYKEKSGWSYEVYKKILNIFYGYNLNTNSNDIIARIIYLLKKRTIEVSHIPKYIENGKLLDIGCSYGNYLKKMETLGWEVYGTEINEKAVEYANEKLKLDVDNIFFEENQYVDSFFDIVNMNMVVEHIYEPNNTIKEVARILKNNGQLMLSVPDISGFESTFYKQYAYGLQVPEHLQHFTPRTITILLEQNGFKVEKIVHQNFDRDLVASAGYMKNKLLSKILDNKFVRKTVVKLFVTILANIGKTSRMSIYARKQ